jgi:hypothetical protein
MLVVKVLSVTGGVADETHLSAESSEAQESARIQGTDEHKKWAKGDRSPPP